MKKATIILLIIVFVCLLCASQTTRAIHPDTPIYEEADFSSAILFSIPQNAQVLVLEKEKVINNIHWIKIQYGSYTGFTNKAYLYQSKNAITYSLKNIKATSKTMGQQINIYESNSIDSKIINTVKDGTKLTRVVSTIDYGHFYEINYNNQRAFILKENATTTLTYNQKIALIISGTTLAVILAMLILIKYIKTHKREGSIN